jgi:hypothetical protein
MILGKRALGSNLGLERSPLLPVKDRGVNVEPGNREDGTIP